MPIHSIPAATLHAWLDAGEAELIDVREPGEFASGHIPGAVSRPLGSVCCAALPAGGRKLVVQCKGGTRGRQACERLLGEQPGLTLYHLDGGLDGWRAEGYPIAGDGRRVLPLDRQVQLGVGTALLAGSLAGYFTASPGLFLLTGFIGAGLFFAGITGFCGMARLLARMPWNR